MFVSVAVHIPSEKTFTYAVPPSLEGSAAVGKRVLAPFGKKRLTGCILERMASSPISEVKEIIDVLDDEPLFSEEDLQFYRWASDYYLYPLGRMLGDILPGGIDMQSRLWVTPAGGACGAADPGWPDRQRRLIDLLKGFPEGLSAGRLKRLAGSGDIHRDIRALAEKGLVAVDDRIGKPRVAPRREKVVSLDREPAETDRLSPGQRRLIDLLRRSGSVAMPVLSGSFRNASALVGSLAKRGLLTLSEREAVRRPGEDPRIGAGSGAVSLNESQGAALREISRGLAGGRFFPCLLHGVTGSGKTEVYIRAVDAVLRGGGGAIVLVPEIALTPQLLSRFREGLPGREIAVLHSGVSRSARYDQWRNIGRGDMRIVVGARSALFAPVRNLRLIVVDEEHDGSYKQEDRMRYHARDLAVVRAKLQGACVVLGSATPSLETYWNSRREKYRRLHLPRRVEDRPLPPVEIVDMKAEGDEKGGVPILSRPLVQALRETLGAGRQALLLLNRRGFNAFLSCRECGHVFSCRNCTVSLTRHAGEGVLKCHYCGLNLPIPGRCPACGGNRIHSHGAGTEKLEETVRRLFPDARVDRMDRDTASGPGDHGRILQRLDRGEIDILAGTQMIAKGHDFPGVTLVGVVSADTALHIPDFRAAEKTFQLLTQVSGRGGRGDDPGRVVIQTLNPGHYALRWARDHDYEGFFGEELAVRRSLNYPPFSRMINLHMSCLNREAGWRQVGEVKDLADRLIREGAGADGIEIIGPAESPVAKVRGRYRWQMLLKGEDRRDLRSLAAAVLSGSGRGSLRIGADVDPQSFM